MHIHSAATTGTYAAHNSSRHKVTSSPCKGIYIQEHAFTKTTAWTGNHYHADSRHYYEFNSTCDKCGRAGTKWISPVCTGPPCYLPYSVPGETEQRRNYPDPSAKNPLERTNARPLKGVFDLYNGPVKM